MRFDRKGDRHDHPAASLARQRRTGNCLVSLNLRTACDCPGRVALSLASICTTVIQGTRRKRGEFPILLVASPCNVGRA